MKNNMMMKRLFYNIGIFTVLTIFFMCTDNSNNNPGFEYMPDMYRSPSIETQSDHNIEMVIIQNQLLVQ